MNGRFCRHQEENSLIKDNTGGLLPFSAGVTLTRSQRVFPIRAQLKMLRSIFFILSVIFILAGCDPEKDLKYKTGDIVYLKPDSTKGVVGNLRDSRNNDYEIIIGYDPGFCANNIVYVKEEMIYQNNK